MPAQPLPLLERPASGLTSLIPYTNPKALTAYYCGVFALIPCVGALLGVVALVFGILGLKAVRRDPRIKGTAHAIVGIVLGGIAILFNWSVIFLALVAVAANPTFGQWKWLKNLFE